MKRVRNLVKKRQKSSQSSDDRSTGGGGAADAISRTSVASSATSSVLQFQRSPTKRSPTTSGPSPGGLKDKEGQFKYNYHTQSGKDKSLSKLHIAVWKEDLEKVKKYVKQGRNSTEESKAPKKLKNLLGKEENLVNSRDRYARTPLHLCASNGNETILWQLLSHGADVHAKDSDGATPLHRATDANHDDVARMILDRGCSLDVADVDGDTALHVAVRRDNNEVLAVLLRKGANPDLRNKLDECPLHEAIRLGSIATAQLLLRAGCEVNIQGPDGQTPLILAAKSGSNLSIIVDTLLNYEADPLMTDNEGQNAIDYAVDQKTREMLKRFVDESRHRSGYHTSDNHSFDDDIDNVNPDYSVPFGMEDDDQPIFVVEQVPVEDLSSWESSQDEDLHSNPNQGLKHSPGMMDLSKFLQHSDEENDEKIYDTVENVHQEVAKLKKDPENSPATMDSEPESWNDTPPLPDDDHLAQVHDEPTIIETPDLAMKHSENQPKATPSFTYGVREEDIRSKAENLLSKTPESIDQPQHQKYEKLSSTELGLIHSENQQSANLLFPSSKKEEFVRPEVEHLTEKVTPVFEENVPYDGLNLTKLPYSSQDPTVSPWDDDSLDEDSPPLPDEESRLAVKKPYSDITKQQTENQQTTTPPLYKSANEKVVSLARVDTKDMLEQLVRHKQTNLKHFENEPKTSPPLSNSAKEVSVRPRVKELAEAMFQSKTPLHEQPMSLDLKDSVPSAKRRGSRKSRSLRSTHLAMMSRPLVTSIIAGDDPTLDKSSSSEISEGKPTHHYRRRGSKPHEVIVPPLHPLPLSARPVEDMKKEFLNKLQRQNASLLNSSVEEDDEELQVPDLTILDPDMMAMEKVDLLIHIQKIQLELDQNKVKAQEFQDLCETLQTKEREQDISIMNIKHELAMKEVECKKWVSKIQQADELVNDLEEKDRQILDLNANLNSEKEKRMDIERIFEQREKELKNEISMMKGSYKYEQENALDLKEKEIFDLNENLEYEKEKRKNMERMFQDLTERENELQKQLKVSKEKIKGLEDETTRSKGSSFELIEKLKLGNRDKESVIDQLKSNHSTLEKQILSKDEKIIELHKEITKTIATSKEADSCKEKLKAEVSKLKSNQSALEKKIISKDERINELLGKVSEADVASKETDSYKGKLEIEATQLKRMNKDLMTQLSEVQSKNDKLQQEKGALEGKNVILLQEKSEACTRIECQTKLEEKINAYETLSLKHANLLVAKKELENELMANISSTEVADELSAVKFELKRLHGILAEKEKELVTIKLQEGGHQQIMGKLKSDVINKEAKIHEVELILDMEHRKIEAYEDHIRHLNQQLKELQDQTSIVVQERSAVFSKLKSNFQADENINAQLIKELKEQLRHEQDKLQKALERVNSLEADKIQIEIELNQLKQKCTVANDDLKEMTTKCHNLEDELMKEKLTNQYGQHYANIPAASKSINTVSQEDLKLKLQLLESSLTENQMRVTKYEEAICVKDQIIRALEDKLASTIEADSQRREKDMKKMKLRYEVMARMELNAKLSEVNAFLERRAEEQTVSEQERDRITDHIQKDLSSRLQQSRQELNSIRQQMKDTEKGINGLQRQLETRDQELADERSKRQILEKHFEKKTQHRLMNDLAKQRTRVGAYF